jgi:hypothetical protein
MSPEELELCVAKATVDFYRGRCPPLPDERNTAQTVARIASVPIGYVRQLFRDWGFGGTLGGGVVVTEAMIERIEAMVELPLTQGATAGSQHFNITTGDGSQVQAGHHVSGSQTMATYQQVLEALRQEIERSPMPPEQKKSALEKLGEFIAIPGVTELITVGADWLKRL